MIKFLSEIYVISVQLLAGVQREILEHPTDMLFCWISEIQQTTIYSTSLRWYDKIIVPAKSFYHITIVFTLPDANWV